MLEVVLYFVVSYTIAVLAARMLASRLASTRYAGVSRHAMTRKRCLRASLVGFILLLPVQPYVAVAVQGVLFAKHLRPFVSAAVANSGYGPEIYELRVLAFDGLTARVYAVTQCNCFAPSSCRIGRVGIELLLTRHGDNWVTTDDPDSVVWTDCGNADDNVFPPFPSGGFLHN
jgi:hypothetical protein